MTVECLPEKGGISVGIIDLMRCILTTPLYVKENGKVVAVASFVKETVPCALGALASVERLFFEQERLAQHFCIGRMKRGGAGYKDLVELLPLPFVAVAALTLVGEVG